MDSLAWLDRVAQAPLSEVVENQRRKNHQIPSQGDRFSSEVAQIRVECFCPCGHQKDAAQDDERVPAMGGQEPDSVKGLMAARTSGEDTTSRTPRDCKYQEPHQHDWTEKLCHRFGSLSLETKEANQDQNG